jgi:hypothetical protein
MAASSGAHGERKQGGGKNRASQRGRERRASGSLSPPKRWAAAVIRRVDGQGVDNELLP